MKRSLFRVFASLAIAALAVCTFATDHIIHTVTAVYSFGKTLVLDGFKLMQAPDTRRAAELSLVQAKSFVQRIVKRERPTVTPGWRMCPSI